MDASSNGQHQVEIYWVLLPKQLGIEGTLMDHHGTLVKAFSKNVRVGLAIKAKILTLLENLKVTKVGGLSNLLLERGFYDSSILGK